MKDRAAADSFYKDILGFREMWHGGMTDDKVEWVSMRVPDGGDWMEYMLYTGTPSVHTLGSMNHLALRLPNMKAAYKTLTDRGLKWKPPQIGRDGRWELHIFDPNGTRVELQEPKPVRTPCCSPVLE